MSHIVQIDVSYDRTSQLSVTSSFKRWKEQFEEALNQPEPLLTADFGRVSRRTPSRSTRDTSVLRKSNVQSIV